MALLEHRNYFKVAESNLETIRNDIWDVEITEWPTSVYNPGFDLIKRRLKSVDTGSHTEPVFIQKDVLGHQINSPGGRNSQPADLTFNFVDREDQSITFMINDYLNQCGDPDTGFTRHITELRFECTIVYYNTLLRPYRRVKYFDGCYNTSTIPDAVGEHGGDNSEVSLVIHFAHHKRTF